MASNCNCILYNQYHQRELTYFKNTTSVLGTYPVYCRELYRSLYNGHREHTNVVIVPRIIPSSAGNVDA